MLWSDAAVERDLVCRQVTNLRVLVVKELLEIMGICTSGEGEREMSDSDSAAARAQPEHGIARHLSTRHIGKGRK